MPVYTFNPLDDSRWQRYIDAREDSSVFHTLQWLDAVRKTYGYEPVVYTTAAPGQPLSNGVLMCRVRSWLTGSRLVSVPFADHCDLLADDSSDRLAILGALREAVRAGPWRYIEIRPKRGDVGPPPDFDECNSYFFHTLDMRPSIEELFASLHRNSTQRKIRRAEREGLVYEEGRSDEQLADFYRLYVITRRRHQLPPQPFEWFRNLIAAMSHRLTICAARKDGKTLGSTMMLRHRNTLVYKYGASEATAHHYGTMRFIFWRAICAAKNDGVEELDLGRSKLDNEGLITFKDRLGASRTTGHYLKHSKGRRQYRTIEALLIPHTKPLFARLPDRLLVAAGRLLYRHIG